MVTRTEDVHKGDPLPGHVLNFTKDKTLVWGSTPTLLMTYCYQTVRCGPVTVGMGDVAFPTVTPSLPCSKSLAARSKGEQGSA